jgi:hypothetical protein
MKVVYIAQLKCPNNHCVIGVAHAFETAEEAQQLEPLVMGTFRHGVQAGVLNNECGLCHSTTLHVEVKPTAFRTMEEARPMLREEERKQAMTAQAIKASRN